MIFLPIPRRLMPDNVQISIFEGSGRYGDSYSESVEIRHTRLVRSSQIKTNNMAQTIDFDFMWFVDPKTSKQVQDGKEVKLQITPKEKDQVTYGNQKLTVSRVNECKADQTVHHWEIELKG